MKPLEFFCMVMVIFTVAILITVFIVPHEGNKGTSVYGGVMNTVSHDGHLFVIYRDTVVHHPQCTNSFCK
jgi:preprotein translocase subunit SecG